MANPEKQGFKQGLSKKSDSAGFIAKMKPESWSVNGFLLAISMPFAVSFELFSVLALGMLHGKVSPKRVILGFQLGLRETLKRGFSSNPDSNPDS